MRQLLIKMLGGMTKLEHLESIEKLKDECESFYDEYCHLYGNNHSWSGDLSGVTIKDGNLIAVRSNSTLNGAFIDNGKFVVAPWARCVFTSGVMIVSGESDV